jgi:hypothetical protein
MTLFVVNKYCAPNKMARYFVARQIKETAMPKVIRSEEFDQIAKVVGRFPDGAELDEILGAMAGTSRRTLQRRLADLLPRDVSRRREQKSFKYRLAPITGIWSHEAVTGGGTRRGLSRLPEGAEQSLRAADPGRRPVSYNIILEAYRPNHVVLARKLPTHTLGRSPADLAPAGTFARDILNRLLIDLSGFCRVWRKYHNRLDTERLIRFGSRRRQGCTETQMILNHKMAIEYLVHDADRVAVNAETIIAVHAFLSDGLLADPMACGKLRNRAVEIGGSVYLPMALPQRIMNCLGLCSAWPPKLKTSSSRRSS